MALMGETRVSATLMNDTGVPVNPWVCMWQALAYRCIGYVLRATGVMPCLPLSFSRQKERMQFASFVVPASGFF